jgi:hypothetical protein
MKQRAVMDFKTAENVPPIAFHRRKKVVYNEECVRQLCVDRKGEYVEKYLYRCEKYG